MSTSPSPPPPERKKPRKKRQADDLSLEDLLSAHKSERAPGQLPPEGVVLIGVDLELQRRMVEGIGLAPGSSRTAPPRREVDGGAPINTARQISPLDFGAQPIDAQSADPRPIEIPGARSPTEELSVPESGAPELNALNTSAPNFSASEFNVRDLLVRGTPTKARTVHPVSRIEHAFTSAERDLLRWLWENGRQVPGRERIRLVAGPNGEGARRLAVQAGLIYNTFKNLTRALSTKFAVDIVKPEKNLPTIYVIYQESAILARQRQAGFTGAVHKNGGGRALVDADSQPAPRRRDLTVQQLEKIVSASDSGALN